MFLVILASLVNFFLAGYNLLLPYTNRMYEGLVDGFYSTALAMEAVGGIIFTVAVLFMPLGSFIFSALLNAEDVRSFYVVGGGIMVLSMLSVLVHYTNKKA